MIRRFLLPILLAAIAPRVFAAAYTISGSVRNESGTGVSNVDLDFVDKCTRDNVFLVNDKTAPDGSYSVVVNEGTYEIRYTPPTGSTLAATERDDYTVAGAANLGVTTLRAGRLVSGNVRNTSAAGIAGVDLKFVDAATGKKVYSGKDVTSSTGAYSVRIAPGTYDVEYRPPATTTYVTGRRRGLVVATGDVAGLVDTLPVGFNVNGSIRDFAGAAVKNVDLNFYDDCTGEKIATANDNTDAQGKYSLYLPSGTYSIHYNPPACRNLAGERLPGQQITRNTGINNVTLLAGQVVTGRVLDDGGAPLPAAKLKFYDAATGTRQGVVDDDTDVAGNFRSILPAGTWDVNVEPPTSRDLLVARVPGVLVASTTSIGDITLALGQPLSGTCLGPGNAPVLNVNVNVVDSVTRSRVRLAHDSSAADGAFRVVVPPGTFDVQYAPPACTGLAPAEQRAIPVASATALPAIPMVTGSHAIGRVLDDATPQANHLANVDLDFYPVGSALKSYTPNDGTSSTGDYDVVVQPGSYSIDFVPPRGSRQRPVRRTPVALWVDTTLPDVVLPSGSMISGSVHAAGTGLAVSGVNVETYVAGTSALAWTPHNGSDVLGTFSYAVDAGAWDLRYVPPAGSGLAPRWRRGVTVGGDVNVGDTLLDPLTVPTVTGISPGFGGTAGGLAVTVTGSGFQPDAVVRLGGVTARNVAVVSATTITATTPPHPAGTVSVSVVNPGSQVGSLASAFRYDEPATPPRLTVSRSGADVVLTWTATGQSSYTVFENGAPQGFSDDSIRATVPGTSWTDAGGASGSGLQCYVVD